MKGCIIAGVMLILVLAAVVLNAVYVRNTVEALLTAAEALPSVPHPTDTPLQITALRQDLEKHAPFLGITIPYNTIDRVSEALLALEAAAGAQDLQQYTLTRAVLTDLIREIGRTETVSMDNIL